MSQEDVIEILENLLLSIKQRGYKKTLNLLKPDVKTEIVLDNFQVSVLNSVCQEFNLEVTDLIENRYARGNNKYAVGFCVHYLYSKFTLGDIHKNIFKNKTKTLLSKYRTMILELNKNEKVEEIKKIIEIKERLDSKIENR